MSGGTGTAKNASSSGGIGLGGAVFIVFLVMKLAHVIDWSWWWVTAPIWAPIAAAVLVIAIMIIVAVVRTKGSQ